MDEIIITKDGAHLVIHFTLLEDWDSFDTIINILKNQFMAVVSSRIEMPESKLYKISIGDANFSLINDPYGNSLRADNKEADNYIEVVFKEWSKYS